MVNKKNLSSKKILIFLLFLILIIVGILCLIFQNKNTNKNTSKLLDLSVATEDMKDRGIYKNDKYKFQVKYSPDWEYKEGTEDNSFFITFNIKGVDKTDPYSAVLVEIDDGDINSVKEWVEGAKKLGEKITNFSDGNKNGFRYSGYEWDLGGVIFTDGKYIYRISKRASDDITDTEFETFLSTFEFY